MITIKQAPTETSVLGQKIKKFPSTIAVIEIPQLQGGKWQHGLSPKDLKRVEEYYGVKFDNSPEAREFWTSAQFQFKLKHSGEPIGDIENDIPELLRFSVLKAATGAADSLEDVRDGNSVSDFVVVDTKSEMKDTAALSRRRNEASYKLTVLSKTKKHLIAVAKYLYPPSNRIDDADTAYVRLDQYIKGEVLKSQKEALTNFEEAFTLDKERLYTTVDFRQAFLKNIIRKNSNQRYYNVISTTEYGKTEAECVEFLLNPKNQEEIGTGGPSDNHYSIRQQLKSKL